LNAKLILTRQGRTCLVTVCYSLLSVPLQNGL
jgi:hypothetical protein